MYIRTLEPVLFVRLLVNKIVNYVHYVRSVDKFSTVYTLNSSGELAVRNKLSELVLSKCNKILLH